MCIIKEQNYKIVSQLVLVGGKGCIQHDSATMTMLYHYLQLEFFLDLYNQGHVPVHYEIVAFLSS